MEITFIHYLIICPLVFLAGLVDAIAGGGGLISLPAYLITGLPVHMAIATNKLSAGMGTALTTYKFAKKGFIPLKLGLSCGFFGLIGSTIGARLALLLSDAIFKKVMLVIIPLTAIFLFTRGDFKDGEGREVGRAEIIKCCIIGLFLGVYDGFYGPGMGTFLMIAVTAWVGLSIKYANGVCKSINMATNTAALVVYLFSGKVIFELGLVAGCFGILGNYIGASYFEKGNTKLIKPLMIAVLLIFFVKIVLEEFFF